MCSRTSTPFDECFCAFREANGKNASKKRTTSRKSLEKSAIWRLVPGDGEPGAFFCAFGDGFAEDEFVMAGGECGEGARGVELACVEVGVKVFEQLDEGVRVALGVSAGVGGVTARGGTEQRWVLD